MYKGENVMKSFIIIALIVSIIITVFGIKQQKKVLKYIGGILIILCLVYILPNFISGFVNGVKDTVIKLN